MKKQIIVTGGRGYDDFNMVSDILDLFDIGAIIQGGANGADKLAREYAKLKHLEYTTVIAEWDKHGRAAGPIRNRQMLQMFPEAIVLAFPGGAGTDNCVKTAVELNMIVLRVQ